MENNEALVTEVTEKVEETTEQTGVEEVVTDTPAEAPKTYTDAEVDDIVGKRLARQERSLRKDFEKEMAAYREAESVLNAGLGTSNITEATNNLREFYTNKGVEIPKYQPSYNDYDMKAGAEKEANSIIELGYDDVVAEVDRLSEIGLDNMTDRERLIFIQLGNYRKTEQDRKELAKIGVKEEALQEKEFVEFAKDLNPNMSIKDKYEKYLKYRPKPMVETMGSMKNATDKDSGVKDFYTRDEALKFTKKDLDKNPALFKAIENSMSKW